MKKRVFILGAALTALLALSVTAAAADSAEADGIKVTTADNQTYSVEYSSSAAEAGQQFVLLIVKQGTDLKALDVNSILYIDQTGTDAQGKAAFLDFKLRSNQSADIYIGGGAGPLKDDKGIEVTGVRVTGEIVYQGTYTKATVSLIDKETGSMEYTTQTTNDGVFAFEAVSSNRYKLVVTKDLYLSYTKNSVTINSEMALPSIDIRNLGGDINGNGEITSTDLSPLLKNFNGRDVKYDINGNGEITSADLSILLSSFNNRNYIED